ncbi:hypothetical protein BOSEA1005_12710 [Hyphomicrobiales bacterium]|nr:hypothetical protein BOSEA1005_12710 [Hyphomicrobiales bacterium]
MEADSPAAVLVRSLMKSVAIIPKRAEDAPMIEITARLRPLCRRPDRSGLSGGAMVAGEGLVRGEALDLPSFSLVAPLTGDA